MNRIEETFGKLIKKGESALIPYIMAGDPDISTTESVVLDLVEAGADLIELGVPFSDPLADGPTIQMASERSLKKGTTLKKVLDMVKKLRKKTTVPIILMTYYNLIFKYGDEKFVIDAISSGVDGIILPDLPPEEGSNLISMSKEKGLSTIFLLSPTTTKDRIKKVSKISTGFIYYISITGITGAKLNDIDNIKNRVLEIRKSSSSPVCVGFGVSEPKQAKEIAEFSDGVIVGSAIVKLFENNKKDEIRKKVSEFVHSLKTGMRGT